MKQARIKRRSDLAYTPSQIKVLIQCEFMEHHSYSWFSFEKSACYGENQVMWLFSTIVLFHPVSYDLDCLASKNFSNVFKKGMFADLLLIHDESRETGNNKPVS